MNNLEDWDKVSGPFQFSNLSQLLNNQLCQDSSVSFSEKRGQLKMSTMKNGQILLYCFNKIIKEPGTSFQPPTFSQNYIKMFVIQHTSV